MLLYQDRITSYNVCYTKLLRGKLEKTVYANSPDGWDNPEVVTLMNDISEGEHEVEFRMAEGSEEKIFHILGIGTTGTINSVEKAQQESLPYTDRAIVNEGNTSRLQHVIEKAAAGRNNFV